MQRLFKITLGESDGNTSRRQYTVVAETFADAEAAALTNFGSGLIDPMVWDMTVISEVSFIQPQA